MCMCSVQTLAHEQRAHINGKTALLGFSCIRIDAMCSQPEDWPNSHVRFGYGRWRDAALSFARERRLPPISRTCTTNFRFTIVLVCKAHRRTVLDLGTVFATRNHFPENQFTNWVKTSTFYHFSVFCTFCNVHMAH